MTSADIVDGTIQSIDIGTGQVKNSDIGASAVTNSKIGSSAVTSSKIADGAITYPDVSRAFITVEHRDDCNCGGTGWDPDGTLYAEDIYDDRITPNSVVSISLANNINVQMICWAEAANGLAQVRCDQRIGQGFGINYAIFKNPAYG